MAASVTEGESKRMEHSVADKIAQAIELWRIVDIRAQQLALKEQQLAIAEQQESTLRERKSLAQSAKDFRRLGDNEKLAGWRQLVKEFQTGIDHLTARASLAESAVIELSERLCSAPDPHPLLAALWEQLSSAIDYGQQADARNEQLRQEIQTLRDQAAQYERESHALNEQCIAAAVEEQLSLKDAEWRGFCEELKRGSSEQEAILKNQLAQARSQISDLLTERDLKFPSTTKDGSMNTASYSELDFVLSDLEKAQQHEAELEARNAELKRQLASVESAASESTSVQQLRSSLETQISAAEQRNSDLSAQLINAQLERQSVERLAEQRAKDMDQKITALFDQNERLQQKLDEMKDYSQIKQELTMLQKITFNAEDDMSAGEEREPATNYEAGDIGDDVDLSGDVALGKSVHYKLQNANRKLTDEVAMMRAELERQQRELDRAQTSLTERESELLKLRTLNKKLEDDLLQLNESWDGMSALGGVGGSGGSTWGRISPTTSIIGGSTAGTHAPEHSSAIVPIIVQQRDRFRQRISDLERQVKSLQQDLVRKSDEIRSLFTQNSDLHKRLQTAPGAMSAMGRAQVINFASPASQNAASDIDRYAGKYVDTLSPFDAFRVRNAGVLDGMSRADSMIFKAAQHALGRKSNRYIFAMYIVVLHFFLLSHIVTLFLGEKPGTGAATSVLDRR